MELTRVRLLINFLGQRSQAAAAQMRFLGPAPRWVFVFFFFFFKSETNVHQASG